MYGEESDTNHPTEDSPSYGGEVTAESTGGYPVDTNGDTNSFEDDGDANGATAGADGAGNSSADFEATGNYAEYAADAQSSGIGEFAEHALHSVEEFGKEVWDGAQQFFHALSTAHAPVNVPQSDPPGLPDMPEQLKDLAHAKPGR
jgi:hypothetical protein